jgi:hypothetical protein
MIIVAWNGSGDPTVIFHADVFKKVLSVFITAAILKLGQGKRYPILFAHIFDIYYETAAYIVILIPWLISYPLSIQSIVFICKIVT